MRTSPASTFNGFRGNAPQFASTPQQTVSWWLTASRDDFSARCRHEYETRMRGSQGEKMVGAIVYDSTERFAARVSRSRGPWGRG